MCNRVNLHASSAAINELLASLGITLADFAPRYNIAPTQDLLIVRGAGTGYECCPARWGLTPMWGVANDNPLGLFNARSETAHTKPAFREAFKARRCLIPVSGFYEWEHTGTRKQPYNITLVDHAPFVLAGLWEKNAAGNPSCTILTTAANELVRPLHDRMPVIVSPADFKRWLDLQQTHAQLAAVLAPFPAEKMRTTPVSSYVNKSGNEGPKCVEPVEPEPLLF